MTDVFEKETQRDFGITLVDPDTGDTLEVPRYYVVESGVEVGAVDDPGSLGPVRGGLSLGEIREALTPPVRGLRYNRGKPMMTLLVPSFIREMAKVMTQGAEKYAKDNWKRGMGVRSILDSGLRHIYAWLDGEDCDKESGNHHLAHGAVNLMFAFWMVANRPEHDDRAKGEK